MIQIFKIVNKIFVLPLENNAHRIIHTRYFFLTVETKDYNVLVDGRNIFDQLVENDMRTYKNILKIATGLGDHYTIGCLLDYSHFKKYYKTIAMDLSKQQALDADPEAIKRNVIGQLVQAENTTMLFIIEEVKETILDLSQGTLTVLWIYFALM